MIEMSLEEIALVTAGVVHDAEASAVVRGAASVDSRLLEAQGLFVAVPGEHLDGHDFAAPAVAAGAAAVLAQRPVGVPSVVVADPIVALGQLARHVRGHLATTRVVGITGSQGKTSAKDLLAQILPVAGPTVATVGNFNNEIGVPLTVLRADESTAHLVLELGARGLGHIRHLCDITAPQVGVVLNVGVAHLGEFGSREQIARAKAELVESLPVDGLAVLNADDPLVLAMAACTSARPLTFGLARSADVRVHGLTTDSTGRPAFDLVHAGRTAEVRLHSLGVHAASNAAAAAAVALGLGFDLDHVARALCDAVVTSRWRMQPQERADGLLVLNDAYNANPDSMRAALDTLVRVASGRAGARSVAVLGVMRELGASSDEEHASLGRLAAELGVSELVVVREEARPLHTGALAVAASGGWSGRSTLVPDADAAVALLRGAPERVGAGDVVLVKASRSEGLERVATALVSPTVDS
ncbi:MAG: UDP-N-acetylmuramoyl-tripeptide--D-alanyl-D-alanine ligase [Nocardioidaceae bacterium]